MRDPFHTKRKYSTKLEDLDCLPVDFCQQYLRVCLCFGCVVFVSGGGDGACCLWGVGSLFLCVFLFSSFSSSFFLGGGGGGRMQHHFKSFKKVPLGKKLH